MKTRIAAWLTGLILVAPLVVGAKPATQRAEQPHVLIITIDTLRADRLSSYGYERNTSPHLDKIIRSGTRFTQARTVEPLTGPSLCSMLTSHHPHAHGASRNGLRLRSGLPSLPKALQAHGYRTAGFVGNWTLRDKLSGLAEHFETYEEVLTRRRWFGLVKGEATASDLNEHLLDWVEDHRQRHADRPFMAWVHYVEPHAPYRTWDEFRDQLGLHDKNLPPEDRYDTEIAYVDAAVGKLLEGIAEQVDLDDVMIVFASDHGESLGEHDYWGHGRHLYDATLHIPMAIRWPGHVPVGDVDAPSMIVDLAPTVLGLIGHDSPPHFDGFDWVGVMNGDRAPYERITRHQAHRGAVLSKHDSDLARKAGLLEIGMVENRRKEIFRIEKNRRWTFDLANDPFELNSLSQPREDPSEGLLDWMASVYDGLGNFDDIPPEPLDPESAEALRSLGYVD